MLVSLRTHAAVDADETGLVLVSALQVAARERLLEIGVAFLAGMPVDFT